MTDPTSDPVPSKRPLPLAAGLFGLRRPPLEPAPAPDRPGSGAVPWERERR